MDNEDPRHLLRPRRAFGRVAGLTTVILVALWVASTRLQGLERLAGVVLLALIGVWGMSAMLRVDHRLMDLIAIVGLVLAIVSVQQSRRSDTRRDDEPPATSSPTTTSVATPTIPTTVGTTVETTVPVPPSTAAPTTSSTTLPTSTVTTAPRPTPETHQLLWVGVQPALCLEATTPTSGSSVLVAGCQNTAAMNWQVLGGQIRGGPGDKCLSRVETSDRARVITATCDAGRPDQRWSWDGDRLVNLGSCLDVDHDDARTVQLWECDTSMDQLWELG